MTVHYLDNSATTAPSEAAKRAAADAMEFFGNPSSVYSLGVRSRELLESSRRTVAASLGIRASGRGQIVFCASGTEANCLALLGFDAAQDRLRGSTPPVILIGDGEHPSVEHPTDRLARRGYHVVKIPTFGGELDMGVLCEALTEHRGQIALAAFMLVNNETGAIYDVRRAAAEVRRAAPRALIHCDAVQAFTKLKFTPWGLGVDTLTVSAHKINAPRGAAALFIGSDVLRRQDIAPILPGGGQESGLRSGTENLCAVAAFAAAAAEASSEFSARRERVSQLREYLESAIASLSEVSVKRPAEALPDIMNITLPHIKSETMLNFLSERGVYVSAGSACAASSGHLSPALAAFGCSRDEIDSSLRVSIAHDTDESDIDALRCGLETGLRTLVRY